MRPFKLQGLGCELADSLPRGPPRLVFAEDTAGSAKRAKALRRSAELICGVTNIRALSGDHASQILSHPIT
ncbi:MAG TPA: hypothetical protein PKE13_16350, partial [Hyphomicrobium zavarzinii]|nr:hypothetical protein [Hyphomicrobium zavarzinii]